MNSLKVRITHKVDTLENWNSSSAPMLSGEIGLAQLSGDLSSKFELRVGTGDKTWTELSSCNLMLSVENVYGLKDELDTLNTKLGQIDTMLDEINGD